LYADTEVRIVRSIGGEADFLKIGIVGGTGKRGKGLAVRWAMQHDVLVGSRMLDKARGVAKELEKMARGFYQAEMQGSINGRLNADAIQGSEVVVVTLPPESVTSFLVELKTCLSSKQIVVSTVVPMTTDKEVFWCKVLPTRAGSDVEGKSAGEMIQEIVKPASVVSAFHTVPATYLSTLDSILNIDVLIACDDAPSTAIVSNLVCDSPNLRPLNVGPLENSKCIESITPLLLNAAILNHLREPSIRIVPWMPTSYPTGFHQGRPPEDHFHEAVGLNKAQTQTLKITN
jgi:NADPH-dependent F420 reductase